MKIIEKLSKMMKEEICDADKYINCALKYKEERPSLARTFYQLSEEEIEHMNRLHEQVAVVIKEYKDGGNIVPEGMQAVYDFIHEQMIEDTAEVRRLQAMYRES